MNIYKVLAHTVSFSWLLVVEKGGKLFLSKCLGTDGCLSCRVMVLIPVLMNVEYLIHRAILGQRQPTVT